MNIFYLSHDQREAVKFHNDRHVVKMIVEYAQLLSTAHRVVDGKMKIVVNDNGRKGKVWELSDSREHKLYKATHVNHPSNIWTRESKENYLWLYELWVELIAEWKYRYDHPISKSHAAERQLKDALCNAPNGIISKGFTEMPQAMGEEFMIKGNSIEAYKNYYIKDKQHLASWKKRGAPDWYVFDKDKMLSF
jgi:hypothetical protein